MHMRASGFFFLRGGGGGGGARGVRVGYATLAATNPQRRTVRLRWSPRGRLFRLHEQEAPLWRVVLEPARLLHGQSRRSGSQAGFLSSFQGGARTNTEDSDHDQHLGTTVDVAAKGLGSHRCNRNCLPHSHMAVFTPSPPPRSNPLSSLPTVPLPSSIRTLARMPFSQTHCLEC